MRWAARPLVALLLVFSTTVVAADERVVLYDMLRHGSSFRVRAGAALTLGRSGDPRHVEALEQALHDRHSAVRAAAANALGDVGSPLALPSLQMASRDENRSVSEQARASIAIIRTHHAATPMLAAKEHSATTTRPSAARLAIVVGSVENSSGFLGDEVRKPLRSALAQALRGQAGVLVIDPNDAGPTLASARRQSLPVLRMEANLLSVQLKEVDGRIQVRCEVTLMLLDEGERTLRSVLRGAASTVAPPHGSRTVQERLMARAALANAVKSALHNASHALADAAQRASVPVQHVEGVFAAR